MEIKNKRIGNLEFRKATYLGEEPNHPTYQILMWQPNKYYGHDDDYPESETDPDFRIYPDYPQCRIHKSCFKHPETCFAIAGFEYDSHEPCYELRFVGSRPVECLDTPELREIFWELIKYGDKQLTTYLEEEDNY